MMSASFGLLPTDNLRFSRVLSYYALQKFFCRADDLSEQFRQPTVFSHGVCGLVVDLLVFQFNDGFLRNTGQQCHVRCAVPFLPCGIVRFNLRRLGIVLANLLGGKIHTVRIKHPELLRRVGDMAVDQIGIDFF